MKGILACLLMLAACASSRPAMPLEQIFERPEGVLPTRFAFFHDEERIAYLKAREASGLSDLWVYDIATGTHRILMKAQGNQKRSAEERAARERRRDRTRGISTFRLNPRNDAVLLQLSGDLHLLEEGRLEQLTRTKEPERAARWSPDGKSIA
ncbi:MAG: hypothetical protein ACYTGV_13190, partial [Planctomycetota bacterium]